MNIIVLRFLKLVLVTAIFQLILYKTDGTSPEQFGHFLEDINGKMDIIIKFLFEFPANLSRPLFEKFSNFVR